MIYVCYKGKRVIGVTTKFPFTGEKGKFTPHVPSGTTSVKNRNDWKSFEEVTSIAKQVTAITGTSFIPVDNGEGHYPRYDITDIPKIGDEVSYAFNGDISPDGKVVKVTKKLQVVTDTGHRYNRFKASGAWRRKGTWWLVKGHMFERNPHI